MSVSFNVPDTPSSEMIFIDGVDQNGRKAKFSFELEQVGDLNDGEYGHSVLVLLVKDADVDTFESMETSAAEKLPDEIEFKPFVKDSKFFLKLKQKGEKYAAIIDPPTAPTPLEKTLFLRGANLVVDCTVSMWINYKSKQAGLFVSVSKITVDGGKKKIRRR